MSSRSKHKNIKTNAMRMLEDEGIGYETFAHELKDGFTSGSDLARMFGQNPEQVFKTLVLYAKRGEYYVCVIPVDETLDLKKAASFFGVKKLEMLPMKELLGVTGYVHGGCSPVGMKKAFPTAVDETAVLFDDVFVSGGQIGLQIKLKPDDLIRAAGAEYADLTAD
ncbi:MAG: Cys-tRNA(Pro) deacylase [Anaerovoracaceae bacterium]|jgi:Cys-tRNA(Pro)/Cys-tRNA(Cys) deacylase